MGSFNILGDSVLMTGSSSTAAVNLSHYCQTYTDSIALTCLPNALPHLRK